MLGGGEKVDERPLEGSDPFATVVADLRWLIEAAADDGAVDVGFVQAFGACFQGRGAEAERSPPSLAPPVEG